MFHRRTLLLAPGGAVQQAFLATRVRVPGHREGQMQMERTLRRLGRRRIDLMQVHELIDFATHVDTLRRWRAIGHASYIGATITSHDLAALERELPTARLDTVGSVLLTAAEILGEGDPLHAGLGPMPDAEQRRRLQALVDTD